MSVIEVDFGQVDCWDNDSKSYEKCRMKLSYNSDEEFSYTIRTFFESGNPKGFTSGRNLEIEMIDEDGLVSISGSIFLLNPSQIEKVKAIKALM